MTFEFAHFFGGIGREVLIHTDPDRPQIFQKHCQLDILWAGPSTHLLGGLQVSCSCNGCHKVCQKSQLPTFITHIFRDSPIEIDPSPNDDIFIELSSSSTHQHFIFICGLYPISILPFYISIHRMRHSQTGDPLCATRPFGL